MKRQEKMKQERQNNGGDHLTRLSRFLYIVGVQSVRVLKKLGRWLKKKLRPLWMFIGLWLNRLTGRWIAGLKAESKALGEGLKIARARLQKARSFGLLQMMEEFFQGLKRTMTDNNKKQAMVPRGCTVMYNENGTAPGIIQEGKGKILMMFPGPPRELIPMFETYAKPYLAAKQDQIFVSRVLRISKVGESEVEHLLQDIIDRQTNPTIATYVKRFEVIIRLTAKAKNEQEANRLIDPVAEEIHERLGINLYAEGETSVAEVVSKMLLERKETIAVAESLTGGMVASALVDYPGISASFLEGAVTYSNEAKMRRLGVKEETLQKYGAVSAQTAAEMAIGIAKTSGAGIGLSTTGIAGPGGGSAEKPVGTVYLGLWYHGKVKTKLVPLVGNRERIRIRAMEAAFDWLRRTMLREEAPQGEEEKANG